MGTPHGKRYSRKISFDISCRGSKRRSKILGCHKYSGLISADPHFGLEASYMKLVYLRAGLGNLQQVYDVGGKQVYTLQPNLGLGLRIKSLTIDYALTDIGDQSAALYSHVFSLRLDLNKKPKT